MFDSFSQGSRQGAVPDPLLHRRPPRHHRRGHAEPGAVAEEERLPPRPGADLPADADGAGDDHVPHREEPAEEGARRQAAKSVPVRAQGRTAHACTRPSCATTTPDNWPLLREALKEMGRDDLIGNGKKHLIPAWQPAGFSGQPAKSGSRTAKDQKPAPQQRSGQRPGRQPIKPGAPRSRVVARKG